MKKIILSMLAGCVILVASVTETKAQVSVGVSAGIAWNPPAEYSGVNYYYLPDVEGYYYVPTHQYVYNDGGRWVFRSSLPSRYASYDIRTGYKVAVNRPRAYTYFDRDRSNYGRYRGVGGGHIVRSEQYIENHSQNRNHARALRAERNHEHYVRHTHIATHNAHLARERQHDYNVNHRRAMRQQHRHQ